MNNPHCLPMISSSFTHKRKSMEFREACGAIRYSVSRAISRLNMPCLDQIRTETLDLRLLFYKIHKSLIFFLLVEHCTSNIVIICCSRDSWKNLKCWLSRNIQIPSFSSFSCFSTFFLSFSLLESTLRQHSRRSIQLRYTTSGEDEQQQR